MLVVDEADRMLDVGFEEQLLKVHAMARPNHQSCLFLPRSPSASWASPTLSCPSRVRSFTLPARRDFDELQVGISEDVVQIVHVCAEHKKPKKLMKFLKSLKPRMKGSGKVPLSSYFATKSRQYFSCQNFSSRRTSAQLPFMATYRKHSVSGCLRNLKQAKYRYLYLPTLPRAVSTCAHSTPS